MLGCDRAELYAAPQRRVSASQRRTFARLLARRLAHEPLQYLLGQVDFMGLTLHVAPGVLIPRPETETLVERVVEFCTKKHQGAEVLRCLDVGTGSGNIAAALAYLLTTAEVVAVDCSAVALRLARENFKRLELQRVHVVLADVSAPDFGRKVGGPFDLVVANLPYVPSSALPELQPEVKDYEPVLALDGGEDGLVLDRALVPVLPSILTPGGAFFAEIGEGQGDKMVELLRAAGLRHMSVFADLAGRERVVFAQK